MDSTTTLAPPTAYHFSQNNMKNTTVSCSSTPLYTITTNLVADTHTHINVAPSADTDENEPPCRLATITRRAVLSDTVTFYDGSGSDHPVGKLISMHKWLKKCTLPDGYPAHVMCTPTGTYLWRSNAMHRLGLYDPGSTQPIAHLQPASPTDPLTLFIEPSAEPYRVEILVACLILEQRLRVLERNISVGGGKFEQNKTVLGHYVHT